MINLTLWLVGLWNAFVGGMWKSSELQAREALECCEHSLMAHVGRGLEAQNAERCMNGRFSPHDVSDGAGFYWELGWKQGIW